MKMTRKQALIIMGSWMTVALGRRTYAEHKPEINSNVLNMNYKVENITFHLDSYKKMIVKYGDETVEYTTKELFEALKK